MNHFRNRSRSISAGFKISRGDEERLSRHSSANVGATADGAVSKTERERRTLRDQTGCGLEQSSLVLSELAFKSAFPISSLSPWL